MFSQRTGAHAGHPFSIKPVRAVAFVDDQAPDDFSCDRVVGDTRLVCLQRSYKDNDLPPLGLWKVRE